MARIPLPRSPRSRIASAATLLVLIGLAAGAYAYEQGRTGSVYPHPNATFIPQSLKQPHDTPGKPFIWPNYGYTLNHLRYFAAPASLAPPFHQLWQLSEGALLEFPPVIYGEKIIQLADNGVLATINRNNGTFIWVRKLGALSASTPAVSPTTVYVTLLAREAGVEAGRVIALDIENGDVRWSRNIESRTESSPILSNGVLYFGSESGTVYALNASNGNTIWTYHAEGPVKASPSLQEGTLYFGDYAGDIQAVNARTGRLIWRSGSEGAPLGSGTFYSTAAVAFGRVYLGNTDGRIYAYDQRTGSLDWAVQTGAYVYASPAVADAPGLGPTIYLGSYDGHFYAINARSGHVDWSYDAEGRISGSATIVGDVVYFSDLGSHRTYGLNVTTGQKVFEFPEGAFDPVITDGHVIYLTGYNILHALVPSG